jgi:predicted adenine nucleotide alpha hydrolase (AANH) superfamily ATPase/VanZ family protein
MRKRLYLFILTCWLAGVLIMLWYPMPPMAPAVAKITFYDKAAHFVFFGVLAFFLLAIGIRWRKFRYFWTSILVFLAVGLINLLGEYVQGFIPGRVPSFSDFLAGAAGAVLAIPIAYMIYHRPKKKILLHVCCAPCATAVREILDAGYRPVFYFYNPNIHPEKEYRKRLAEVKKLALRFGVGLRVGKYDHRSWQKDIAGYEADLEGGDRCKLCFSHNLKETAAMAKKSGFKFFATTLTISPYKNSVLINNIGDRIGRWQGIKFLSDDFKENNGWQRSLVLSKQFGFYRQKYCGCEYSIRPPRKP